MAPQKNRMTDKYLATFQTRQRKEEAAGDSNGRPREPVDGDENESGNAVMRQMGHVGRQIEQFVGSRPLACLAAAAALGIALGWWVKRK